jgi:hypothetical protein
MIRTTLGAGVPMLSQESTQANANYSQQVCTADSAEKPFEMVEPARYITRHVIGCHVTPYTGVQLRIEDAAGRRYPPHHRVPFN